MGSSGIITLRPSEAFHRSTLTPRPWSGSHEICPARLPARTASSGRLGAGHRVIARDPLNRDLLRVVRRVRFRNADRHARIVRVIVPFEQRANEAAAEAYEREMKA